MKINPYKNSLIDNSNIESKELYYYDNGELIKTDRVLVLFKKGNVEFNFVTYRWKNDLEIQSKCADIYNMIIK